VGEWRIEKHDNDHTKDNFPNNIINKTSIIMLLKKVKFNRVYPKKVKFNRVTLVVLVKLISIKLLFQL
jgi:hypothetical protein